MKLQKHVIITGGAKGVGAACSKLFQKENYQVSIFDVDQKTGKALEKELGDQVQYYHCDVADSVQVKHSVKEAINRAGPVEVLVNNAGIQLYGSVTETSEEAG